MKGLFAFLRSGAFVTRPRIVTWSAGLLLGFAVALTFLMTTAHGINDYKNRPLGSDFSNIYAAGVYAREDNAAAPFDPPRQHAEEQALFGKATPFFGWHYPPFFLLVAAPLARLPYLHALFVWQLSTLALYLAALGLLLRKIPAPMVVGDPVWVLLALAFPAAFVNLIHGHNGFLTAALLAAGLALLDERPILAGATFGLLVYKPQFLAMVPLVLIATQRWRALAAAALTVTALAALVTMLFGLAIWPAFLASTHFTRTVVLEQGNTGFYKIQSVFAWVRLWGGSVPLAYAVQGIAGAVAAVLLVLLWRKPASFADRGAALCLSALLTTPYCLDYDLVAVAPAIALLGAQGIVGGFRPYEKTFLAGLWLVPICAREIASVSLIPIGVITTASVFALIAGLALRAEASKSRTSDAIGLRPAPAPDAMSERFQP